MMRTDPFEQEMAELSPEPRWHSFQDAPHQEQFCRNTNTAEKLPLFPRLPPAEPYPIASLGPVLSDAAAAIARKVQVPEAIAAQAVLAAASLAAQAHADVLMPYGQTRPLSLYFLTVAGSGDRKSTADKEALWPIRRREETLHSIAAQHHQEWLIANAAWVAEKRKIEADRKLGFEDRKAALMMLGPEPEKPLRPNLTVDEPTFEGLIKNWSQMHAALGLFTAEGGQFTGGHGMAQENRLRTAAGFSIVWDGQPVTRVRALDGVSSLQGRRLAMHLMVQPDAATEFLANPVLRDQGLLSRVLVVAPDSLRGTRYYRESSLDDEALLRAYRAHMLCVLEAPWPVSVDRTQGLQPRALEMTSEAQDCWREFYDHIEDGCGPTGELRNVGDFAAKAAEHAARIAGVLTIVENHCASEISSAAMARGVALTHWYVAEATRLQQASRTDPKLLRAQGLLDWLRARDDVEVEFRDVLRFGPSQTRTKDPAEAAIATLKAHGLVEEPSGRPRRVRLVREEEVQ